MRFLRLLVLYLTAIGFINVANAKVPNSMEDIAAYTNAKIHLSKKQYPPALKLFKSACEGQNPQACTELGLMYAKGKGMSVDTMRAAIYFSRACDLSDGDGCSRLGGILKGNTPSKKHTAESRELLKKGCDLQSTVGCTNLGLAYQKGDGVTKNYARAKDLYEKSCALGSNIGCHNKAYLMEKGYAQPANEAAAYKIYQENCNKNLAVSCYSASRILPSGRYSDEAFEYLKKACNYGTATHCKNGAKRSKRYMETIAKTGEHLTYAIRMSNYYKLACKKGDKSSCTENITRKSQETTVPRSSKIDVYDIPPSRADYYLHGTPKIKSNTWSVKSGLLKDAGKFGEAFAAKTEACSKDYYWYQCLQINDVIINGWDVPRSRLTAAIPKLEAACKIKVHGACAAALTVKYKVSPPSTKDTYNKAINAYAALCQKAKQKNNKHPRSCDGEKRMTAQRGIDAVSPRNSCARTHYEVGLRMTNHEYNNFLATKRKEKACIKKAAAGKFKVLHNIVSRHYDGYVTHTIFDSNGKPKKLSYSVSGLCACRDKISDKMNAIVKHLNSAIDRVNREIDSVQ